MSGRKECAERRSAFGAFITLITRSKTILTVGGIVVALGPAPLWSQAPPLPIVIPSTPATSDTFVNDSFEAGELVDRVGGLVRQHQWTEASRLADRLLADYADRLIAEGDGRYVSISGHVTRLLSRWPLAGLSAYRELFDAPASKAFLSASSAREVAALLPIIDRYFYTSSGPRMVEFASELAMESGDFALARQLCLRMVASPWARVHGTEAWSARLAIIAALEGDSEEVGRRLADRAASGSGDRVRWSGSEVSLDRLVRTLLEQAVSRRVAESPEDVGWPVFGGNNARNAAGEFIFDRLALLWGHDVYPDVARDGEVTDPLSGAAMSGIDSGKFLAVHPVTGGGRVFFQDANRVWAIQAHTGTRAWDYVEGRGDRTHTGGESTGAAWYAPTYHNGQLYACLGEEVIPYYGYESTTRRSAVVRLDPETGRRIWTSDPFGSDPDYAQISYGSSPVVTDAGVYVVARRRRTFGFEDCYLLHLRGSDGRLMFQTHLGSASTGGFGYRRSTLSIPSLSEGIVYVASNLGTVAAVSARTGEVRWLRVYARSPEAEWRSGVGTRGKSVRPWHFNPAVCTGGRLICRPMDASILLVLNRDDGRVIRRVDVDRLAGCTTLLGVMEGQLYGSGSDVFRYDVDADKLIWRSSIPEHAHVYGRGTIASGKLLLPTDQSLCAFDLDTGQRMDQPWAGHSVAGNLVATDRVLLVAGNAHVSAYGRRADVWARLRARMADDPNDPVPALELAEIAYRSADPVEAMRLLDDAVARAGGFSGIAGSRIGSRVYRDCLWFAKDWPSDRDDYRERVERLYSYAGQSAQDRAGHIRYRLRFAEFLSQNDAVDRAVKLYQQILTDESLREAPWGDAALDESAGSIARRLIEQAIARHGREVYEPFDAEARSWLVSARSTGDTDLLDRILITRPSAVVAADAMTLKGELYRAAGQPMAAARVFATAIARYAERIDRVDIMRRIAECHAAAGHHAVALKWLDRALREFPAGRVTVEGRTITLRSYRDRFAQSSEGVAVRRPRLTPPLSRTFERSFPDEIALLTPSLPPSPASRWHLVLVYDSGKVRAFAPDGGDPMWDRALISPQQPSLLLMTDTRVVLATEHRIVGLDTRDGSVVWAAGQRPEELDDPDADPEAFAAFHTHAYDHGRLVSIVDDGRAFCIDVESGDTLWQRKLRYRPTGPAVIGNGFVAYRGIASGRSAFRVLKLESGETHRSLRVDDDGQLLRQHLTADGRIVLVFTRSVQVYDIDAARRLWRRMTEDTNIDATVVFDVDGVYLSEEGTHITKVSLDDGSTVWRSEPLFTMGVVGAEVTEIDEQLIVASERSLTCLDTIDGRSLWVGQPPTSIRYRERLMTESFVVAIDGPSPDREGEYTAYFLQLKNRGEPAIAGGTLELGTFRRVHRALALDDALILQAGKNIYGWSPDRRD